MAIGNPKNPDGECTVRSHGETDALASRLIPEILKSAATSLEGPLGAGKTRFVKAVAMHLGIADPVSSPTFTLVQSYGNGGRILHHSDWYRLGSEAEIRGLGLEEYYGNEPVLIEWGDRFPESLPPDTLRIRITPRDGEERLFSWCRWKGC